MNAVLGEICILYMHSAFCSYVEFAFQDTFLIGVSWHQASLRPLKEDPLACHALASDIQSCHQKKVNFRAF